MLTHPRLPIAIGSPISCQVARLSHIVPRDVAETLVEGVVANVAVRSTTYKRTGRLARRLLHDVEGVGAYSQG